MLDRFAELARQNGFEPALTSGHLVIGEGSLFSLHLDLQEEGNAFAYIYVRTTSWQFAGERSDLHHLLSLFAGIALHGGGPFSARLIDQPNDVTCIEGELWGRYVTFGQPTQSTLRPGDEELWKSMLFAYFLTQATTQNLLLHEHGEIEEECCHGDPRIADWVRRVSDAMGVDSLAVDSISRTSPEWDHVSAHAEGMSVTRSRTFSLLAATAMGPPAEAVEGPNAWLFPSGPVLNAVPREFVAWAERVIEALETAQSNEPIRVMAIENWMIAVGQETVVARRGEYGREVFLRERQALQQRQQAENRLIFPTAKFDWSKNIDGGRFEELVAELLKRTAAVSRLRRVGGATEPDGGRDFLCEWLVPVADNSGPTEATGTEAPVRKVKVVVQCKASKGTVGVTQVHGIRDMMEHYEADGYLLVVSSRISVALLDRLTKLEAKFSLIECWERATLEDQLIANRDLLDRFADVVVAK